MSDNPEQRDNPAPQAARIYTRRGDGGVTRLASGREVPKNHPRLNAYGTLDELQVAIGGARDALTRAMAENPGRELPALEAMGRHLVYFQQLLFKVSCDLATPLAERWAGMPLAGAEDVNYVERMIDHFNRELPPLRDFILPGGHPAATALHVCRVVCRRAEREIETLAAGEALGDWVRPLVNRMSDAFFVLARRAALEMARAGVAGDEQIWRKDVSPPLL